MVLEGWKPLRFQESLGGLSQAGKKQELDHRNQSEALVGGGESCVVWSEQRGAWSSHGKTGFTY